MPRNLLERHSAELGEYEAAVEETLQRMDAKRFVARMWHKDATLWKSQPEHSAIIKNSLGWLTVVELMRSRADDLKRFADEVRSDGIEHVVVLGMGGSSLCPEVFRRTFGKQQGYPELHVLDSTVPEAIRNLEAMIDIGKTLFIVASKSGTTTEPRMFHRHFYNCVKEVKGDDAGKQFIAITDPRTKLAEEAEADKFRRIFINPADIGGRYSALSYFGIVPAALMGIDISKLLDRAQQAVDACAEVVPIKENPGARLAAMLGTLALKGRDKVTLITPPPLDSLGLWIEQLVAESTGKEGQGIVPVAGEPLSAPDTCGADRLFALIHTKDNLPIEVSAQVEQLAAAAGHPVIRHVLNDPLDLAEEFFIWEFAVGLTGALLGINSFDQPNVQESKDNTKKYLDKFIADKRLPQPVAIGEDDQLKIYSTEKTRSLLDLAASTPSTVIRKHLMNVRPNDYIALTAYIAETPAHNRLFEEIRQALQHRLHVATTLGYAPRFLHSTGQLHKGGADNGVFIQITAETAEDLAIPGEPVTFGILQQAQALGDFESLENNSRRAVRLHLQQDTEAGLHRLLSIIKEATTAAQA